MYSDELTDRISPAVPKATVSVSRWVNERFPDWEALLTSYDVARLTRRPRWLLAGLALVNRFPAQQRFRGRAIGWLRADVMTWLAKDIRQTPDHVRAVAAIRSRTSRQRLLPLGHSPPAHTVRHRSRHCMKARDSRARRRLSP